MIASKTEPWYISMRAEASAKLLLIKIPGIRLEQDKRGGPDLLVFLPDANGNPTSRLMGVEVKATSQPRFGRDGLPLLPPHTQRQVDTLSENSAIPFCLFYFITDSEKGEQAWAKWLVEPKSDGTLGSGALKEPFFPLNEEQVAQLVYHASQWYETRRAASR